MIFSGMTARYAVDQDPSDDTSLSALIPGHDVTVYDSTTL